MNPKADFKNQRGQATAAISVMIMILLALLYGAVKEYRRIRMDYDKAQYKEWAIEAARSGFSDSQAYFRNLSSSLIAGSTNSHSALSALSATSWTADYPDSYFMAVNNSSQYTDNYSSLTFSTTFNGSTATAVAAGMMRSYPFNMTSTAELSTPHLWVRYVLKRQNVRNWSPLGNTMSVNTDPEAVHDVSDARISGTSAGSGTTWGITCRSYIYSWPYSTDLITPSYFVGNNILNAPLNYIPPANTVPLLIATAKVYGEITALSISLPNPYVPVTVNTGSNVTVSGSKATLDGGSNQPISQYVTSTASTNSGGTIVPTGNYYHSSTAISLSTIFPGSSIADLSNLADKVGDVSIFPDPTQKGTQAYENAVSTKTFYVINSNAVFNSAGTYCLVGVGLVVVNGNLTIQDGNASDFAGIVFVNGNVTMNSGLISGCLVATGTVTLTGGTTLSTNVSGNYSIVSSVEKLIDNFRVNKASVLTN